MLTVLTFQEPLNFFTKRFFIWDCEIIKKSPEVSDRLTDLKIDL